MKKIVRFLIILSVLCIVLVLFVGNPIVFINNRNLAKSIKSIEAESVEFNDIVPFKWDSVYTFDPYTSKEDIEKIIGFKSRDISESVSEGMVQLLFVKDNKVISDICGYGDNLGYSVWLGKYQTAQYNGYARIDFEDNAVFSVENKKGIIVLERQ